MNISWLVIWVLGLVLKVMNRRIPESHVVSLHVYKHYYIAGLQETSTTLLRQNCTACDTEAHDVVRVLKKKELRSGRIHCEPLLSWC